MKNTKRQFTQEYKVEAVRLWEGSGRKSKETGEQLGVNPECFAKWKRAIGQKTNPEQRSVTQATGSFSDAGAEAAAEIGRLKRELQRVKLQHEILKKQWASYRRHPDDL